MPDITVSLAALTALCLLAVGYTYFGYPILVAACARLFGRPPLRPTVPDAELPTITLVVAALNEEREIGGRVENALASDYPAGKLTILVASDGSTDLTASIVRRYAARGVRLIDFPVRRGKAAVLNEVLPSVTTDLILLTDANTHTRPDATRLLAAWFADPAVGVVCGRLVLTDPKVGRNVDSLYWKYETFLKKCESRLGALLGSNGGIYAVRRAVYQPIPPDTIVDDFVIPLMAKKATGCRIVYDAQAVAVEETPETMTSEFHRRARIGAGGFQAIGLLRGLLHPRHGWLAFAFASHKVLRWVCPFFLLAAVGFNLAWLLAAALAPAAAGHLALATALLSGQAGFYTLSLLAGLIPDRPKALKVLRLPAMFTTLNAALLVGFIRWARGRQHAAWRRTTRSGEMAALPAPATRLLPRDDTARLSTDSASDSQMVPAYNPRIGTDSAVGVSR